MDNEEKNLDIYHHTGFSSAIAESFSSPGTAPGGLAWDGTNIVGLDDNTDKLDIILKEKKLKALDEEPKKDDFWEKNFKEAYGED